MPHRRRWTLILVPPDPNAPTHSFSVSARAVRTVATTAFAVFIVGSIWSAANANSVVMTADELARAQQLILALHDTVHTLRSQVLAEEAAVDSAPEMIMPVAGRVTSRFTRSRLHPLLQIFRPHHGIDLSAPAGTHIVATARGTVSFVGWRVGDGLTVEVTHNGGVTTRYAHCQRTFVNVGQRVGAGQEIATVGASGIATGPHVHFEVLFHGTAIDPLQYLAAPQDSATAVAERLMEQGGG